MSGRMLRHKSSNRIKEPPTPHNTSIATSRDSLASSCLESIIKIVDLAMIAPASSGNNFSA